MTSNMHFVKDIVSGRINKRDGDIIIGKNCWINSGSFITKGTILPDYSITARNCFVNKDYSGEGSNIFLAGSPAKVIKRNVQRIFNPYTESNLKRLFESENIDFLDSDSGIDHDDIMPAEYIINDL